MLKQRLWRWGLHGSSQHWRVEAGHWRDLDGASRAPGISISAAISCIAKRADDKTICCDASPLLRIKTSLWTEHISSGRSRRRRRRTCCLNQRTDRLTNDCRDLDLPDGNLVVHRPVVCPGRLVQEREIINFGVDSSTLRQPAKLLLYLKFASQRVSSIQNHDGSFISVLTIIFRWRRWRCASSAAAHAHDQRVFDCARVIGTVPF